MDITNKTHQAITLSLPGGKKLFLGPGKTGQIHQKALERPSIAKRIEAGELEVQDGGGAAPKSGDHHSRGAGQGRHGGSGTFRPSGDR